MTAMRVDSMKRWLIVLMACIAVCVVALPASAAAQSPKTTVPVPEPSSMSTMEWVQSLRYDPAFSGFTVERSVIFVAKVPGREFAGPVPPSAASVEFVDGRLSQQEVTAGLNTATELLKAANASVIGVSYDPFADQITISREPDPAAFSDLKDEAIDAALVEAFGPAVEGVGHHIEVIWTAGPVVEPDSDASTPVLEEPIEVATSNADRLIYVLLGLVVVLGAVVVWALSAKSDAERQLWIARNPKSQHAM